MNSAAKTIWSDIKLSCEEEQVIHFDGPRAERCLVMVTARGTLVCDVTSPGHVVGSEALIIEHYAAEFGKNLANALGFIFDGFTGCLPSHPTEQRGAA